MKIVLLTREYPPDTTWGGCSIVNYNLAKSLAAKGHEVHVICQGVGREYDLQEEGVYVHRVGKDTRAYSITARLKYLLASRQKLAEIYKEGTIDIIQADYWSGEGLICALRKKSILIIKTQTGITEVISTKNTPSLKSCIGLLGLSSIAKFTALRADRFISESKVDYFEILNHLNIDAEKVDIINNGIDTNYYRVTEPNLVCECRLELGLPIKTPIVLSVGRIEKRKGADILTESIPLILRKIPDVKFVFVGRDTDTAPGGQSFKAWIEAKARNEGFQDNLIFKGFISAAELPILYSVCDAFVLSSRKESFGLVVLEAMACGAPVVSTSVGIVPELIKEASIGLEMVSVESPRELADAILKMLMLTEEEKTQITRKNREIVETKFSFDSWTDKIIDVYENALKSKTKLEDFITVKDESKVDGREVS